MNNQSSFPVNDYEIDSKDISEIDSKEILKTFLRNKKLIATFTILSFFISTIQAFSLKRVWRGEFQIVIDEQREVANPTIDNALQLIVGSSSNSSDLRTEIEILRSPSVLISVFNAFKEKKKELGEDLENYPYTKWLKDNFKIELLKSTSVLNLSYEDTSKEIILPVLNEISKIYQNFSNRERSKSISNGIKYLEEQITIYRKIRKDSRIAAKNYSLKHKLLFLNDPKLASTDIYLKSDPEIIRFELENKIVSLEDTLKRLNKPGLTDREILFIAQSIPKFETSQLFREIVNLNIKIASLKNFFKENDTTIQTAIRTKKNYLESLSEDIRNFLKTEIEIANISILANERPPEVITQYKILLEELQRDTSTLTELENQKRVLSLDQAKANEPWELITNPTILDKPVGPKRRQIAINGALLGFIFSFLIAFLIEKISDKVYSEKTISKILNKKLLFALKEIDEENCLEIIKLLAKTSIIQESKGKIFLIPLGDVNEEKLNRFNEIMQKVIKGKKVVNTKNLSDVRYDDCQLLIASIGITKIQEIKNVKNKLDLQAAPIAGWLSL